MKKPALPLVRGTGNAELDRFCQNAKQTMDSMTGQGKSTQRLSPLPATATLAQVVERVNAITLLMQGD